ncbi:MAG: NUDIX domain-containing protein [Alphaproteobacteria bacterium]|nr:NUDIX domain-containing protein [Alphaproteobacteria bacterium]
MAEFWDVYDINGNKLNKTIQRGGKILLQDGEYHMGSAVFIIDENKNFLIQQRSFSKNLLPGKWAITGGSTVAGENAEQCAIREVKEELGIKLTPADLKFLMIYTLPERHVIVNLFVAQKNHDIKYKIQKEELEQAKWVSRQELIVMHKTEEFYQPLFYEILEKIR